MSPLNPSAVTSALLQSALRRLCLQQRQCMGVAGAAAAPAIKSAAALFSCTQGMPGQKQGKEEKISILSLSTHSYCVVRGDGKEK